MIVPGAWPYKTKEHQRGNLTYNAKGFILVSHSFLENNVISLPYRDRVDYRLQRHLREDDVLHVPGSHVQGKVNREEAQRAIGEGEGLHLTSLK